MICAIICTLSTLFCRKNRIDRALDYIKKADLKYEDTHLTIYCKNELLNSIISLYDTKFSDRDFTLKSTGTIAKETHYIA